MIELYNGDCLDLMKDIPDRSVDMILTDPPYNTTDCHWDKQPIYWIPLKEQMLRVIKPTGTIAISVQNPFGFMIGSLFSDIYRHRWVWEKDKSANFQCVNAQPLRNTEDILIFQENGYLRPWNDKGTDKGIYNPQMREGKGNSREKSMYKMNYKGDNMLQINNRKSYKGTHSMNTNDSAVKRYPVETLYFQVPFKNERIHPTQKPVPLFEYLIKTYTNEDMLVLDCFAGSMTTAIAAHNTNRKAICIEKDSDMFEKGSQRLKLHQSQMKLF